LEEWLHELSKSVESFILNPKDLKIKKN